MFFFSYEASYRKTSERYRAGTDNNSIADESSEVPKPLSHAAYNVGIIAMFLSFVACTVFALWIDSNVLPHKPASRQEVTVPISRQVFETVATSQTCGTVDTSRTPVVYSIQRDGDAYTATVVLVPDHPDDAYDKNETVPYSYDSKANCS